MIPKNKEKEAAIALRKKGHTYSEILKEIPVSKSTLSLWLRDVGLSKKQKQHLTKRKLAAMRRGSEANRKKRLELTEQIKTSARKEINELSNNELWLMGVMLYWAEGSKEKSWSKNSPVELINMDPMVLRFFLKWLKAYCGVKKKDLIYTIYIHKNSENVAKAEKHWRKTLNLDSNDKMYIYYKKHNPKTVRKHTNNNYFGSCAVRVKKSTNLNRTIAGWFEGICYNAGIK